MEAWKRGVCTFMKHAMAQVTASHREDTGSISSFSLCGLGHAQCLSVSFHPPSLWYFDLSLMSYNLN
jgi:hypothetical protein